MSNVDIRCSLDGVKYSVFMSSPLQKYIISRTTFGGISLRTYLSLTPDSNFVTSILFSIHALRKLSHNVLPVMSTCRTLTNLCYSYGARSVDNELSVDVLFIFV